MMQRDFAWRDGRIGALVFGTLGFCVAVGACSVDDPPRKRRQEVAQAQQEFSSDAHERIIPLRVVQVVQNAGAPDNMSYAALLARVHGANEVFKAAGVQFWLKSVDRWVSPNFYDLSPGDPVRQWSQVKAELNSVLPNLPLNAWADWASLSERRWLRAAATRYGDRSEAIVWVVANADNTAQGFHPEWGSAAIIVDGWISIYAFAHELAHSLGSAHTWDAPWTTGGSGWDKLYDPATLAQVKSQHYWDLVYKPGAPNKFYVSESDATPDSTLLQPIQTGLGANCTVYGGGLMSCVVNGVTYWTGDPALKGLAFSFASGMGANVSSYNALDDTTPHALSDSQIARIRRYLRYDALVFEPWYSEMMAGAQLAVRPASGRPALGEAHNREATFTLDFDHDGLRDVGVWVPPTDAVSYGQFIVLLSTRGFSASAGQYLNVQFGRLGDVPVPADYNNDGFADVAVYQPGGGYNRDNPASEAAYWRWCATNTADPTTTSCGHDGLSPVNFGYRRTVPLPALDFDGNPATAELAYYDARDGIWAWVPVTGGPLTARLLGSSGQIPLPALYDYDFKTDIAVYNPADATFRMARSELAWSTTNLVSASFGSQYVAQPNSNPGWAYAGIRSGSVALSGMNRPRWVCQGNCFWAPRRTFSLWSVDNGMWVTKWDIFAAGAPTACQWGVDFDIPIPGIDRDGDGWTDRVIYRADSWSSNAWLCIRNSDAGSAACSGAQTNYQLWSLNRPRNMIFSVSDMTGDGKAEILVVDPDQMTINWLTSESDYTSIVTRQVGNQRAVVL